MQWPPKSLPRNFPLTVTPRGYVVSFGGKTRWVCGKRAPVEAMAVYHRKAIAWGGEREVIQVIEAQALPDDPTLHEVMARWLLVRRDDAVRGELSYGAFGQYKLSAKRIDKLAGHLLCDAITPDTTRTLYSRLHKAHGQDFARRSIGHLRTIAREAEEMGWCRPLRLGSKLVAKLARRPPAKMKWRLYTRDEIRLILLACNRRIRASNKPTFRDSWVQLKAMILLALNGGYGARELAELPRSVVDLAGARIDYRRGKTDAEHVVPLWPETVRALRKVMRRRADDELLFRNRAGNSWCYTTPIYDGSKLVRAVRTDNVAFLFNQLVRAIDLKISGQSFYKLRHLFATTADRSRDRNAVALLMGHSLGTQAHYIRVDESRLREVVDAVRHELLISPGHSAKVGIDRSGNGVVGVPAVTKARK